MFIAYNKVRMHDTDMAGILYFARQFRFAHDALEDFVESMGYTFDEIFRKGHFIFVIAHAEADYLSPLSVADQLQIHVSVTNIGTTSFTIFYKIYNQHNKHVGNATTVHVTLDAVTRKKIPIPHVFLKLLQEHLT